jgi:hypothetical protein
MAPTSPAARIASAEPWRSSIPAQTSGAPPVKSVPLC